MRKLNPLDHPICFAEPKRLTRASAWHQHIPLAMYLVDVLRPQIIVELGTQYGDSYCAFCQAVKELNLETRCYAIDSWQGDPDTGWYGPEVLTDLRAHHDPLYGAFSSLVQSTFREALGHFANGSIDLLHIDGYHGYEQAKEDFTTWLPKVSQRAVILLHDTNVRERDFGVWTLWEEIKDRHPHFEFFHGYGLGFLAVGETAQKKLQALLSATSEEASRIRYFFFQLGYRWDKALEAQALAETNKQLSAQVEDLRRQAEERTQWAKSLDAEVAERRAYIGRLQAEFEERSAWAKSLDAELAESRAYIARLQAEFEERSVWAERLNTQIAACEQVIRQLQERGEAQSQQLTLLEGERARANALQEQLGEAQRQLQAKEEALEQKRAQIQELTGLWQIATASKRRLLLSVLAPLDWMACALVVAAELLGRLWRWLSPEQAPLFDPPDPTRCSIIVLNWEGKDLLAESLPPLLDAVRHHGGDHEVIVVDNGSTDGSSEFIREHFPQVRLVQSARNQYYTGGNNLGVNAASQDIVVLLNNDMIVARDFLGPLLAAFSDASVFGVASQVFLADPNKPREETGKARAVFNGCDLDWRHDGISPADEQRNHLPVFWAHGGAAAFDRRKFLWLAGLDTLYDPFYVEDADLSYRAWKVGWQCLMAVRSHVVHKHRGTNRPRYGEGFVAETTRRNHYLFLWKNFTDLDKLVAHFWRATRARIRRAATPGLGIRFEARAYRRALRKLPAALWRHVKQRRTFALSDDQVLDTILRPQRQLTQASDIDLRTNAFEQFLGDGWYALEPNPSGSSRWMARSASVYLPVPAGASTLRIEGYVPPLARYGTSRLFLVVSFAGRDRRTQLAEGPFAVTLPVTALRPGELTRVILRVSSTIRDVTDSRELGLIVNRIALEAEPSVTPVSSELATSIAQDPRVKATPISEVRRKTGSPDGLRILFCSPYSVYPVQHGGAVRMYNVLKRLSELHEVHYLAFVDTGEELETNQLLEKFCASVTCVLRRPDPSQRSWSGLEPSYNWQFRDPRFSRQLDELIRRYAINVLQLEYTQLAQYAREVSGLSNFLTEHDVSFIAWQRRAQRATALVPKLQFSAEYLRMLHYELSQLGRFDAVFTVTEREGRVLQQLAGNNRVVINWRAPTGTDVEYFSYIQPKDAPSGKLLFVGNFRHTPNIEAATFLLKDIVPALRARWNNIRIQIIGANPPHEVTKLGDSPTVEFMSYVDDLRPFYAEADGVLVPIRQGAGVRVKILEAFAAGTPVIATSMGMEGIAARPDEEYLLAETSKDFLLQVSRLRDQPGLGPKVSQRGRKLVEERYAWSRIVSEIENQYRLSLAATARRKPSGSRRPRRAP